MADKLMAPQNVLYLIPRTCEYSFTEQKGVCRCDQFRAPGPWSWVTQVSSVSRVLIREKQEGQRQEKRI